MILSRYIDNLPSTDDRYVADAAAAQYGYATGYMDDRGGLQGGEGCVMMVYGIEQEKLNCDKLFNVLCQYGNVLRVSYISQLLVTMIVLFQIKFMRAKADTAMVEFGSSDQVCFLFIQFFRFHKGLLH